MKEAIEGLALQKPPLPTTVICRHARQLAHELGEAPPSYWVVYRIVSNLPADLVTLAHDGTQAYSNTFELVYRREADGPNAIWQADHTLLDILLVRPDGPPAKPWLTTVIDDHSRAVAGYFLSFEAPSALHTSLALRAELSEKPSSPQGANSSPPMRPAGRLVTWRTLPLATSISRSRSVPASFTT